MLTSDSIVSSLYHRYSVFACVVCNMFTAPINSSLALTSDNQERISLDGMMCTVTFSVLESSDEHTSDENCARLNVASVNVVHNS